ncbi:MAG: SEL1-like repeat protein [Parvularculaceae bacterium]|nr:SEL1-like repeat protein [Parvularculaceae bacterium]
MTVSVGLRRTLQCAAAVTALALAIAGSASANFELGQEAFKRGQYDIAIDTWKKFAEAGDIRSKKALGDVFSDNICSQREAERMAAKGVTPRSLTPPPSKVVPVDNVEALKWYILAAHHDFSVIANPTADEVRAQVVANSCLPYVREVMTTSEVRTAEDRAAKTFERGSPRDLYNLGLMFQRGAGVSKDNTKALMLFELAKTKGVGEASQAFEKLEQITDAGEEKAAREMVLAWQPPLPELYDKNPPHLQELERLRKELNELRNQDALQAVSDIDVELIQRALKALGFYFGAADNKMGPDTRAAIRRFQYSLVARDTEMTEEEKEAVRTGVLTAKQTVELVKLAAKSQHPMSQYVYGIMHARGVGVVQNGAEAVKWLQDAADADLALAHYALGVIYRDGTTGLNEVEPNKVEAAKHFAKAYALGYKPAGDALKLLEFEAPRQSD